LRATFTGRSPVTLPVSQTLTNGVENGYRGGGELPFLITNSPAMKNLAAPSPITEPARHRLVSARISPPAEMARWLFELGMIPYAEEAHVAGLRVQVTQRAKAGDEVPVVVTAEGVWTGARGFLTGLDAKSAPGRRVLGETEEQREQNVAQIDQFLALLLKQVPRLVYFHLLPLRKQLLPIVTQDAPLWERCLVTALYPVWRGWMSEALDLSQQLVEAAAQEIEQAFSYAERLTEDGRRFIGGNFPGVVDVVFASLVSLLVLPERFGARLPKLEEMPEALREFTQQCRERRGGQLALEAYRAGRPSPQKPLPVGVNGLSRKSFLWSPKVQLLAANVLRRLAPRLVVGSVAIFSKWNDVKEMLSRDLEFLIAPINEAKIAAVTGPFILGMDRSGRLVHERGQMYAALAAVDFPEIRQHAQEEAQRLLAAAKSASGKIDVVNGYARLVAARTAAFMCGVRGPAEAELMRVARVAFHYIFLTVGGSDETLKQQAAAGAQELSGWIRLEIERRRTTGEARSDILGALLERNPGALDDDGITRTMAGLMVGAIDTTATAVGQITSVLLNDGEALREFRQDLEKPERAVGWCWEALRRWPHNPVILRHAAAGTTLAGKTFGKEMTVVGLTLAAMSDADAFPVPQRLDPTRDRARYLHFGGGLHPCAGRAVNSVQVPLLVGELVKAGAKNASEPRFDGPFIDELVVRL